MFAATQNVYQGIAVPTRTAQDLVTRSVHKLAVKTNVSTCAILSLKTPVTLQQANTDAANKMMKNLDVSSPIVVRTRTAKNPTSPIVRPD